MPLRQAIFRGDREPNQSATTGEIAEARADGASIVWIDATAPTTDEIAQLGRDFGFHPLAIEDAHSRHQRPKLDQYDGFLFIVFYALTRQGDDIIAEEVQFFIGDRYLVTLHGDPVSAIDDVRSRWCTQSKSNGSVSAGMVLYSILDALVDDYFPIVDHLSDVLETMEERIFEEEDVTSQREIFRVKRHLLAIRRVLGPERDVMNVLVRRDTPIFDQTTIVYFQDVYDHILRVSDALDLYRDLVTSALDAQLTITSNRLNQVMKKMTASSIILMTVTIVASIYGMNFTHMPELDWRWGYPAALALMASLATMLVVIFRRIDYL